MPKVSITWRTGLCQRRHSRVLDVDDIEAAAAEHDSGDDLPDHDRDKRSPAGCKQGAGKTRSHDQREIAEAHHASLRATT
jgi:hypothetical protein